MSEYWKSTPKYWCKHCGIYVRDSKLERANHEATGKHQNAIKRSLRDLHRNHEKEEREKDRAKREVERLNGVVSGNRPAHGGSRAPFNAPSGSASASGSQTLTKEEQQRQLEQLAELGVNIPTELRPELALAGEWTVTSTRVIKDPEQGDDSKDSTNPNGRAAGVRKRDRDKTEEELEAEEALRSLHKKPKRWGRETRALPTEGDDELDQLLSGTLVKPKQKEEQDEEVKVKPGPELETKAEDAGAQDKGASDRVNNEDVKDGPPLIKHESTGELGGLPSDIPPAPAAQSGTSDAQPAVVFKKRKPKNVRQH
ncbi:WW domain-binding protein 4 [Coniochaeta hoffmannii]|uniref:WW domain-binding protein 4 n=1 Tax=Coniochaeta hoffmannii TaxID=91930 RepID=A0AA38S226_9PEZI|nr:WW domain-binding protein 4 [Coniochaeta hoffmannii]